MLRCKSDSAVSDLMYSPYFPFFLLYRKRQMNGTRQSLNTKRISHLACHSLTLHLWTSVVLTKNSVWRLALSVSNKWTQPKLKNKNPWKKLSLCHFFLLKTKKKNKTESWILPCFLCTYILNCGQKRRIGQSSVQYDPDKSPPSGPPQNVCSVISVGFFLNTLTPVVDIVNLCKKTQIKF